MRGSVFSFVPRFCRNSVPKLLVAFASGLCLEYAVTCARLFPFIIWDIVQEPTF